MYPTFDTIVLGAGALGSAAAYYLAKRGQTVLVIEQFELNHQRGSSYGMSRIIRYAYDQINYVELMKSAYTLWSEIESESNTKLFTKTGGIDFGKPSEVLIQSIRSTLDTAGIAYDKLSPEVARQMFPQFRFRDDWEVIFQEDAGILEASACVIAHIDLAKQLGAEFLPNTIITHIHPHNDHVIITTDKGDFSAGNIVIAAGGWMQSILQEIGLNLPLKPMRCQESYYETDDTQKFGHNRFPTFIAHVKDEFGFLPYGMGSIRDSGLKIGLHGGAIVNHPSDIDYTVDHDTIEKVLLFASKTLPGVQGLKSARICLYTMTPDEHFIIDKHPEFPHIVIAGGCSGHAFKFSTLIGKILSELVIDRYTKHNIDMFGVQRFL
jgi:monomeric sarcosine oxidase